ncbi:HEAT repeat domain-containing protein [Clostridium sp. WILCCON 0269]|uniref:HEAT repeat domain-containing protein n=1 Tax=Candidatus Clostridium eludens TaxID=3381663 RepID=A0ABW8SQ95_9CLOT
MKKDNDTVEKSIGRQKRGQVSIEEIERFNEVSVEELKGLLNSKEPKERTIGATLIGKRKCIDLVLVLCSALENEKLLYPRIAISEALGEIGEPTVASLVSLLGKIGNNQEKELPLKYFNKRSYPLPRDIVSRTLIKVGKSAITELINKIKINDGFETQQAIDALGGIVNNTNDKRALSIMLESLDTYSNNKVTVWKIIRALSGFRFIEAVIQLMRTYESSNEPAIRWESIRSIGQIGIVTPEVIELLNKASEDVNDEVRKAAKIALKQILVNQMIKL